MKKKPTTAPEPRSLVAFVRLKKRNGCKICRLPPDIRKQLREAGEKKISVGVRLEWLREELKTPITKDELEQHLRGGHDSDQEAG